MYSVQQYQQSYTRKYSEKHKALGSENIIQVISMFIISSKNKIQLS